MVEQPSNQKLALAVVTCASLQLGRVLALELGRQGYAIGLHYHSSAFAAGKTADEIRKLAFLFHNDYGTGQSIVVDGVYQLI